MSTKEPDSFRDKLSMIEEDGHRATIYPASVKGRFRNYRSLLQAFLILLYLILPWIKINNVPVLLLDLPARHFVVFGIEFWAHDAPLVFFILGIATVGMALATAVFGRIWCGWSCPQTVFLDGIFYRIEAFIEGNHHQRKALDKAPLSFNKVLKKITKWLAFIAVTLIITHTFLAYFTGMDHVLKIVTQSPMAHWTSFLVVYILSALFLFDIGWFREQFCVIMCPYGRFQSVLYDKNTITVQYDQSRGEPRKGVAADEASQGDCVSCKRCVQVCPTGIDIRNGVQMECIACTACIDACDEIMDKVNKPRGLIRYMPSLDAGKNVKILRPRVLVYSTVLIALFSGLIYAVSSRKNIDIQILRSADVPYFSKTQGTEEIIVNSYRLHVKNHTSSPASITVTFNDPSMDTSNWVLQVPASLLALNSHEFKMIPFLIEVPKSKLPLGGKFKLHLKVADETKEISFVGPEH